MIGSIVSKIFGRGRGGGSLAGGGARGGTGGSGTDAALGRGVKGLLRRLTRR